MDIRSLVNRGSLLLLASLSPFAITGCSKAPAECGRSVAMFRETLKTDPTLASVPDSAISLARANKGETDAACVLANGYADDAEQARHRPAAAVAPGTGTPAPAASEFVAGTPRVHFEITPPPRVESTPPPAPSSSQPRMREIAPPPAMATANAAETAAPAPAPAEEDSAAAARAACLKGCESVWGVQPKVACEQRCNGATPLPGATSAPVIVH